MKLEAGRKLDSIIAKELFKCNVQYGFHDRSDRCLEHDSNAKEYECLCTPDEVGIGSGHNEHCHFGVDPIDPDESVLCRVIPDYSTSMEDAWDIVEELMREIFGFELGSCLDWSTKKVSWNVNFQGMGSYTNPGKEHRVFADTVPLAICLAGLKTVGYEFEK